MTLSWRTLNGATGGYDFRYSDSVFGILGADWYDVPGTDNVTNTSVILPFVDTGQHKLTVGTTYFFQVRGKDADDLFGPVSQTISQIQRAGPAKLTNVQATAGNAEVTLGWDIPPEGDLVISYDYRQDGGSGWGVWQNFSNDENNYTVTSLSNGSTYSFQVRAKNNQGSGPDSETVTATPYGPPAAPDLRATPGDGEVRLHWTGLGDSTITKFQYRTRISSGEANAWDPDWDDISGSSATTTVHTVGDLTNTNEYTFEVRAINDQGNGAVRSIAATPTTAETTPAKMNNVQAVVTGVNNGRGGAVTFTWDNPSNGQIDKYQYRYDATESNPVEGNWDVDWTNIPDQSTAPNGQANNQDMTRCNTNIPGSSATIFYQLRAVNNDADDSSTSAVNEGAGPGTAIPVARTNTPGESDPLPVAPAGLTAAPGVQQVTLNWTASSAATQGYQVRQSSSQDEDENAVWEDWADIPESGYGEDNRSSYTVTGLTNGATYTFELRAKAGTAEAPIYGAAAQAQPITPGAPNAPIELLARTNADEQIRILWTEGAPITGAPVTGYEYRQRKSGDASWGVWKEIVGSFSGSTDHIVTGLDSGTLYYFQVRAVTASAKSNPSPTVSATTITPPVPLKPTGLTATAGDDSVTLRWQNPENVTISNYRYRMTSATSGGNPDFSSSAWTPMAGSSLTTTSFEVTGLTVNTVYYFQIQARSRQGDSEPSDTVSARPVPVRGEWSFAATIDPNPLVSGNEDGATLTFTATFTVSDGTATALAGSVGGSIRLVATSFPGGTTDNGKIGIGDTLADPSLSTNRLAKMSSDACTTSTSDGKQSITCEYFPMGTGQIFARTNASPGAYPVAVGFSLDKPTFTATASTGEHSDFVAGFAAVPEVLSLKLQVVSGPPAAPTGFTAGGGNSRATLAWTDPGNAGITGYAYRQTTDAEATLTWDADAAATGWEYRQSQDGGTNWVPDWTRIDRSNASTTSHTVTEVDPDVHSFQVRPLKADPDQPAVVINVVYAAGVFTGTWLRIPGSGATTTGHIVTGLDNGQTYYFQLVALTLPPDGGSGPEATSDGAQTILNAPAKPTGFTATPGDTVTEVILSWTDPSDTDITGYQYRQTTVGQAILTWTADATATGWRYRHSEDGGDTYGEWMDLTVNDATTAATTTISGINPHLANVFEVRPVKAGGEQVAVGTGQTISGDFSGSSWINIGGATAATVSNKVTGLDLNNNTYFFEVQWVKAGDVSGTVTTLTLTYLGSVTLSWDDPRDSSITKYQYRQSTTGDSGFVADKTDFSDIDSSAATTTSSTIEVLTALSVASGGTETETVYTYQIRAVNESGTGGAAAAGPESDSQSANPGIPLHPLTGVTVSYSLASTTFTISWDAHSETNADFEVRGTGPRGVVLSMTAVAGATSSTIQPDRFGRFVFKVRARNNFGPWSESVTVEATASPFAEASVTREVDEDAPAGSNVGKPVVVEAQGFDVTYSLFRGSDTRFMVNSSTGQITVNEGAIAPGTYDVDVAASLSKDGVTRQGAVNVTITVTSSGPWIQLAKLAPIDSAATNAGNAVAVDEESGVIVVASMEGGTSGVVYVYESIQDSTPAILEAAAGDNPLQFGRVVAVDGHTVVVGSASSQVYVFTKPFVGWPDPDPSTRTAFNQYVVLTASDTAANDHFGESVAISGNTIVVGAQSRDDPGLNNVGGAYVYVKPDTGFWARTNAEMATLKAPTATRAKGDHFGFTVAIDGDNVVVGTYGGNDASGVLGAEKAYLFVKPVGGWTGALEPAHTLEGFGLEVGSGFGWSVDIDGNTIAVGERQPTQGTGAVHLFDVNGARTGKLAGLGSDHGNQFGHSVAVSGEYIVVSSVVQPDNDDAGSVQVFRKSANGATPYVLLASGGKAGDRFGLSYDNTGAWFGNPVAIDGGLIVAGATGDDQRGVDQGAAYVFGRIDRVNTSGTQVWEFGDLYSDNTVTTSDGDTTVTILGGAVPTPTGFYQIVVNSTPSACGGTGGRVRQCVSVDIYGLDGEPVSFENAILKEEATVNILERPSGTITVRKRGSSSPSWVVISECGNGVTGECYTEVGNTIEVTGITSFSQYAVTTPGSIGGGGSRPPIPDPEPEPAPPPVPVPVAPPPIPPLPGGGGGGGGGGAIPPVDPPPTVLFSVFNEGASTTRVVAENSPAGTEVGSPVVARDPLQRRFSYINAGQSAALFGIDWQTGQIRVKEGTVLDFESDRKSYDLVVEAVLPGGIRSIIRVTIIVTNVDEPGNGTLAPSGAPEVGTTITTTLSDPDGGITVRKWQWQSSPDGVTWTDIACATSESYTPTKADVGMRLRANVTYDDTLAAGTSLVVLMTESLPAAPPPQVTPEPVTPSEPTAPPMPTAAPEPTPPPTVAPVVEPPPPPPADEGGVNVALIVLIIAIGVAIAGGGAYLLTRRRGFR